MSEKCDRDCSCAKCYNVRKSTYDVIIKKDGNVVKLVLSELVGDCPNNPCEICDVSKGVLDFCDSHLICQFCCQYLKSKSLFLQVTVK